jgi:hypothetical protein
MVGGAERGIVSGGCGEGQGGYALNRGLGFGCPADRETAPTRQKRRAELLGGKPRRPLFEALLDGVRSWA